MRDVHVDTTALTMCIAAKALFNAEVKKDVAEIGQAFNAIVEEIAVRLRRPFRILDAVPTPGNIRYVRAVHRINRLVAQESYESGVKREGTVATYSPYCCWDVMKKTSRCRNDNCGMA